MHRIDGPGHDNNTFTEGDPVAGTAATVITDDWLNAVQEEVAHVIETAGLVLNKPDNTQLLQALNSLYGGGGASFQNLIINGGFRWMQRGSSHALSGEAKYTADRWRYDTGTGGAATIARQSFAPGQTDVATDSDGYLRCDQTGGGSSAPALEQRIETVRTAAGQDVTVGLWLRVQTGTLSVTPSFVQYFGSGGSADVKTQAGSPWTVTTTWTKFSWTVTLPSIAGKTIAADGRDYVALLLEMPTSTTFTLDVSDVQVERGVNSTPFIQRGDGVEIKLCQRYYEKSYIHPDAPGSATAAGQSQWVGQGSDALGLQESFCEAKLYTPAMTWYADSGTKDAIDWGGEKTVTGTPDASQRHTGFPTISGSLGADTVARAHWTADAEL